MAHEIDTSKPRLEAKQLNGRRVIKVGASKVTSDNLLGILEKVEIDHDLNRSEIDYLYKYYKGDQPIRYRHKEIREDICNKIVENRANEIVAFKVGYLCGEPIQYVSRNGGETVVEEINRLNELMFAEDKASQDQELVEWQMICGTAYRLVLADKPEEVDDSPFEMYTLDPRDTYVVYSNEIGDKPLLAVKERVDEDGRVFKSVYTDTDYYRICDGEIIESKKHILGMIPIFEYPANNSRLGAFEIVLPLLDAINTVDSNRMDGVEQFVQAYWKFVGCDIDIDDFKKFLEAGAIKIPPNSQGGNIDVDLIVKELNQVQVQTLKNDMYQSVLTICGMPNRNGGTSTSDTGSAVVLRDGWSDAEARAKDSENVFKRSEKRMLKLVLKICRDMGGMTLRLKDIDMRFTRRNYEAVQSKSQVLISMLNNKMIHPQLAFSHSGLFTDSESAYTMSMDYYNQHKDDETETTVLDSDIREDVKTQKSTEK